MDVRTLMLRSVRFWGDREAIVTPENRLTFAQAWERGLRLANALIDKGLKPGDRVAVLEDNSVGAVDFFLGCTAANFVRVPLYPRNSRDNHIHMIGHTGCRAVVVGLNYAHEMDGLEREIRSLERVIVRDNSYENFLAAQSNEDPEPLIDDDDVYIIRHTAGTTGRSKGVPYTHRTWLAAAQDWFFSYPPVELDDVCLHVAPISHGSGYFFMPIWVGGGKNVLVDKFEPEATLEIMERERVSFMFAVPTILGSMARQPSARGRDWSRLRTICVAGSPITEATARLGRDVFGDVIYQAFGQTETGIATAISPREWFADIPGSRPLRSAGRPLPFVGVEIRDVDTHARVPIGAEGEIAVQANGQIRSFWEDPEATAERIIDGWVLTGDVGRFDENGYLYILDRAGDMIVSGGYNVYPAELENAIQELPAVVEVAVFAIPSEKWGEAPCAVCVVEQLGTVTEQEIIDICATKLGSYRKPARVVITTEPLPKSPVGKVLRKLLREPYWEGHDRRVAGT